MVRISRSFIKGSLIYTLIGSLPMASAILLIPFYMADLSMANFGALSIYMAFSLLIQLLVNYSFDASLYIHYHEYKSDPPKLASFISSAFVFMLLSGGILLISFELIGDWVFARFFSDKDLSFHPYGQLAVLGGICQAIFKVHSNLLQTREKPETFFWANLFVFSGIAIFTIAGLQYYPQTLMGPLGGRLLALALAAVWVLFRIFKAYKIQFNFRLLTASFSFNFYTFIYQLQQWLINYFDRVLMLYFIPLTSVGVYDFALKALIAIEFFMNGLHSSFFPKVVKEVMSQSLKTTTTNINRYYHGLIAAVMVVVSISVLIIPHLIEWLADHFHRPEYKLSISLVPYIAAWYLIKVVRNYFGFPYSVLKYTKPLPVIYTITTIIKLAGVVIVIRNFGLVGIILISMFGSAIEVLLLHYQIKKKFNFHFNKLKILIAPLLLVLIFIGGEFLLNSVDQNLRHAGYFISCLIILMGIYKNEFKYIKPFQILK
ncbi:lipopolysaccharide biosynthesis protein [Chryseotalea sanaruensis]|nr:oligosaccharide flippase family protein [Chryseotalea sanaruensis]